MVDASFGASVRHRRRQAGLTLEALAEKSGVSRASLSKIERGERRPGLGTAVAIADALATPLSELLGQHVIPPVQILRGTSSVAMVDENTGAIRESLFPAMDGVEMVRYTVQAGNTAGPFPPHEPGTREVFTILSGGVTVRAGTHEVALTQGDMAVLPGDVAHAICNAGDVPAVLLLVIIRRS
ncbi:helix-turn-helix domain-containing protein [Embleya sp. MST-111070]|uniref:helix-turn-helix domain-containing protein n=1 Tax=Embleya sp. MST-111070 TaxID=3398231 RepID=UPI003F732835